MSSKLLQITAVALGLAICTAPALAASPAYDYDSPGRARQSSATDEAPPESDEAWVPEYKKSAAPPKKPSDSNSDAINYKLKSKSASERGSAAEIGRAPNLLPPNVKSRPAYGAKVSNWPQSAAPGEAQKASANFSGDSWQSGSIGGSSSPSSSLPSASANRAGQIPRPSQQFAQSSSGASQDYRRNSRPVSASQSSSSASMPESIVAGSPTSSGSAMQSWDDNSGPCNSCQPCGNCDSCCYNCVNLCGCCGWFAGVDYLLLRPTFSEQQAYIKRTTSTSPDEVVTVTDTVVHQDFGYNSSVRSFFGYRCSCNEEIRFTYWNYGATSAQSTGVATDDGTVLYAGHLELNTTPGQHINTQTGLRRMCTTSTTPNVAATLATRATHVVRLGR